jgi:hypothetical protein
MRLIGMMPVRNEAWCLGLSLRVALMWCDEVVVLLHACTDRSHEIAWEVYRENEGRMHIVDWPTSTWEEMPQRQFLLEQARMNSATHLAIIDADEMLMGPMLATQGRTALNRATIALMPDDSILQWPGYNLRNGINQYHSNGIWGNRWFSVAFADDPALSWSGDRFHHREPIGKKLTPYQPIQQGQGGILHLWGASHRRLVAKHALYKVTEHIRKMRSFAQIDYEYSLAIKGNPARPNDIGTPATWTYNTVPEPWWAPYSHLMKYLDVDAEPWQEAEVRRLVAEHGREKFAGLDLFGLV